MCRKLGTSVLVDDSLASLILASHIGIGTYRIGPGHHSFESAIADLSEELDTDREWYTVRAVRLRTQRTAEASREERADHTIDRRCRRCGGRGPLECHCPQRPAKDRGKVSHPRATSQPLRPRGRELERPYADMSDGRARVPSHSASASRRGVSRMAGRQLSKRFSGRSLSRAPSPPLPICDHRGATRGRSFPSSPASGARSESIPPALPFVVVGRDDLAALMYSSSPCETSSGSSKYASGADSELVQ